MTRVQKLETAVRAGLGLRKALTPATGLPECPSFCCPREVVEKYDEVIASLKPKKEKS